MKKWKIIHNDTWFERFAWSTLAVIFVCVAWIIFHRLDGEVIRPVITYTNGVDPMNFQLEKEVYHRGETVYAYTSFCKNREAKGNSQWSLLNERIVFYAPSEQRELATGCYGQEEPVLFKIQTLPIHEDEISNGEHYFTGHIFQELPNGKVIKINIKTESFIVE